MIDEKIMKRVRKYFNFREINFSIVTTKTRAFFFPFLCIIPIAFNFVPNRNNFAVVIIISRLLQSQLNPDKTCLFQVLRYLFSPYLRTAFLLTSGCPDLYYETEALFTSRFFSLCLFTLSICFRILLIVLVDTLSIQGSSHSTF